MTSINSLTTTSSATSIYGNRNVISGLASGMDTETMIENAVSGYKTKITSLQQQQEQVQWKQEAYRSIIDKMVSMTRKYTSYTSSTNLMSQAFFNKAVTSVTNGANKDLISAIGKTSSDVLINGVKQLAQAAKRNTNLGATALSGAIAQTNDAGRLQMNGGQLDLSGTMDVSNISGGMSITYGGSSVYLNFSDMDVFKSDTYDNPGEDGKIKSATEKLVDAINEKLSEGQVKAGNGSYVTASDRILAKVDEETGKIVFEDKSGAGNSIYISGATENMQKALGFTAGEKATSMTVNEAALYHEEKKTDYLSDKTVSFNLDGVTKTVSLGKLDENTTVNDIQKTLQDSLNKQFGAGKVQVGVKDGGLTFDIANGSTLEVTSSVSEALGLGKSGMTSYLDTSKTLAELGVSGLFDDASSTNEASVNMSDLIKLSKEKISVQVGDKNYDIELGEVKYTTTAKEMAEKINEQLKDSGVTVNVDSTGKLNFVGDADTSFTISSGNPEKADIYTESKKMQELTVNGTSVGKFSEDSTLTSVINAINNADTGIKVSYSKMTNEFSMVAKDTGEQGEVTMSGKLAEMFGFGGDADIFDRFDNDELGIMGISNTDGITKTVSSDGNLTTWKDAEGNEIARKIVSADGTITLQKRSQNEDGSYKNTTDDKPAWSNFMRQTIDSANNRVVLEERQNGEWVQTLEQVAGKDGAVNIQKINADGTKQLLSSKTEGQDAIFTATVNGTQLELKRASNTVDMDGMSVTLKGTFGEYDETVDANGNITYSFDTEKNKDVEPVSFTTSADVDTIKDVIKAFVDDYNALVKEIHDAYSTMPNEKSSSDHSHYLPLTDDDKNTMSESAIAAYEEKAKQGILFGSSELSSLYTQLTNVIQKSKDELGDLQKIGITTAYSDGLTTLELNESTLTEALQNDPDSVRDTFARSVSAGASSDGLMYSLKNVLDAYAGTSSASLGVLIQQAGSAYAPSSVNSNYLQSQYDSFTEQIEKWQTKMSDKVDYYTKQFTALEQLIAQMNNQSSMLSGLQGGY